MEGVPRRIVGLEQCLLKYFDVELLGQMRHDVLENKQDRQMLDRIVVWQVLVCAEAVAKGPFRNL